MKPSVLSFARQAAALVLPLALLHCDEPIDHASDVRSLRVMAVNANTPFAKPGNDVQLRMLMHDGSPRAKQTNGSPRPVQILWMGGCENPDGDLFYNCYPVLHQTMAAVTDAQLASSTLPASLPRATAGFGESFALPVSDSIISGRAQATQVVYPYGTMYAFYVACAGVLRKNPSANPARDLPIACYDPTTGEPVGSDDFDTGYFPIFAYDDLKNENPILHGVALDGVEAGKACQQPQDCDSNQACGSSGVCIPRVARCTKDDPDDCPKHTLFPKIDPESAEKDISARLTDSEASMEILWMAYFATAGSFEKDLRVAHDAVSGWQSSFDGKWRANTAAGVEVRLWAVLRDNRNGVVWVSQDVWVE